MTLYSPKDKIVTMLHEESKIYPLLPLRDIVLFPHMVVPLFVGRPKSIKALEESLNNEKLVFMASQKKATDDNPSFTATVVLFHSLTSLLSYLLPLSLFVPAS